jgi:adenine phosphoribosyltransferase
MEGYKVFIRDVPDFPKEGIIFKDITTLLGNAEKWREVMDIFADRYKGSHIDAVACVEARGFIFGGAIAYKLGAALVPVRKKGKLPAATHQVTYDLEYGTDTLEIHQDAFKAGARVLLVDDLLATGGTTAAVVELLQKLEGEIVEIAFLIELTFLKGRERIKNYPVFSLIQY